MLPLPHGSCIVLVCRFLCSTARGNQRRFHSQNLRSICTSARFSLCFCCQQSMSWPRCHPPCALVPLERATCASLTTVSSGQFCLHDWQSDASTDLGCCACIGELVLFCRMLTRQIGVWMVIIQSVHPLGIFEPFLESVWPALPAAGQSGMLPHVSLQSVGTGLLTLLRLKRSSRSPAAAVF